MTLVSPILSTSSDGAIRNRMFMAQTRSLLDIAKKIQIAAQAEPAARASFLRNMPQPWSNRGHSNQEVVSALGVGPHLEALMLSAADLGSHDILLTFRKDKGPVQVGSMMRANGQMMNHKVSGPAEDWVNELVQAFGIAVDQCEKGLPKSVSNSAVLKREMENLNVNLRFQSVPVMPQGTDVMIRVVKSIRLTESERETQAAQELEIQAELKEARSRAQKAISQLVELCNQELVDRAALIRGSTPWSPKDFKGNKEDFKKIEEYLFKGMGPSTMCYEVVDGAIKHSSPLILATENNDARAIEILLAAGADPHQVDERGRTPLACVCRQGGLLSMDALLPVSWVDAQDFNGTAALAEAAYWGLVPVVKRLMGCATIDLGRGATDDAGGVGEPEVTALWLAAQEQHFECCQVLIENGADPRMRSADGMSLIQNAIDHNASAELVELLNGQALRLDERDALNEMLAPQTARGSNGVRL